MSVRGSEREGGRPALRGAWHAHRRSLSWIHGSSVARRMLTVAARSTTMKKAALWKLLSCIAKIRRDNASCWLYVGEKTSCFVA